MGETPIRPINLSDKVALKKLRERMDALLAILSADLGVVARTGNIKYEGDGSACTVQVKCSAVDASGKIVPQHEKDFKNYSYLFGHEGLQPQHLHAITVWGGNEFEIVGLKPRSGKFPLVAKRLDTGKNFCLPIAAVKYIMEPK